MKKFVFIYVGYVDITPEVGQAWGEWFASIAEHIVDSGNPFGPGIEITRDGAKQLSPGSDTLGGYTIINAESLESAEKLASTCPFITAIRVYPAISM
jgi:hypothetical protein